MTTFNLALLQREKDTTTVDEHVAFWKVQIQIIQENPGCILWVHPWALHNKKVLDDIADAERATQSKINTTIDSLGARNHVLTKKTNVERALNNRSTDQSWLREMHRRKPVLHLMPDDYYPGWQYGAEPMEWFVFINLLYDNVRAIAVGANVVSGKRTTAIDGAAFALYDQMLHDTARYDVPGSWETLIDPHLKP